mmetsp:Transcript_1494/g.2195  ORF Transcript_1494/g.2195 Transcript_1494/m.2195 type:complete len:342 (+) Transcript_1494:16-1041(+)
MVIAFLMSQIVYGLHDFDKPEIAKRKAFRALFRCGVKRMKQTRNEMIDHVTSFAACQAICATRMFGKDSDCTGLLWHEKNAECHTWTSFEKTKIQKLKFDNSSLACITTKQRRKVKEIKRLDSGLFLSVEQMASLPRGQAYRYFSVLPRLQKAVFIARDGAFPSAHPNETIVVFRQGLQDKPIPLPLPQGYRDIAHNYALLHDSSKLALYGGQKKGIQLLTANSIDALLNGQFQLEAKSIISPQHPGCKEFVFNGGCAFDGKLSAVKFNNTFFIYFRLNTGIGARYVQVVRASNLHGPFGPAQPLSILGFNKHIIKTASIYFVSIVQNPCHENSLLGFFPT